MRRMGYGGAKRGCGAREGFGIRPRGGGPRRNWPRSWTSEMRSRMEPDEAAAYEALALIMTDRDTGPFGDEPEPRARLFTLAELVELALKQDKPDPAIAHPA